MLAQRIVSRMSRRMLWVLVLAALVTAITGCTQRRPIDVVRASGDQKFRIGDYAAARDEYAEIVSQYPGDWQAQYRLGLCMIETQQYSRARQALETAYTLRPSQEVADGLAKAMFMQKDESKLFAFLRERASTTRTTAAYLELGRYSMQMDDPDSAQVGFDTAIEVDMGKSTLPYIEAAKLEERLGHLDVAVNRLRQAYGINPYDTRVHEMLRRMGEDPFKLQPLPPGREVAGRVTAADAT
jgi:tetratricopeptide (TPR) repeat protein